MNGQSIVFSEGFSDFSAAFVGVVARTYYDSGRERRYPAPRDLLPGDTLTSISPQFMGVIDPPHRPNCDASNYVWEIAFNWTAIW